MTRKKFIKDKSINKNIARSASVSFTIILSGLILISIFPLTGCTAFTHISPDNNVIKEKNSNRIDMKLNYLSEEEILLPEPKLEGTGSLEEAIFKRRSIRAFKDKEIEIEKISQLLWAAQGITKKPQGFRTAPSAGALFPLDIFVIKKDGLFHYIPVENKLIKMSQEDLHQRLYEACLYQAAVAEGDINIVITAVYKRTTGKYGDRGIRYVHLEAGHACQNILLEAVALDLGAVPIGAFEDNKINAIMGLPQDYTPLYIVPVGYPE